MDLNNKNTRIIGGVLVVVLVCVLLLSVVTRTDKEDSAVKEFDQADTLLSVNQQDIGDSTDISSLENQSGSNSAVRAHGQFGEFSFEKVTNSIGRTVLFFDSKSCLSCENVREDIVRNMAQIPHDLMILEVDYDTEIDLREQFNVVAPHTFVQITADGVELSKWSNSSNLSLILAQVQ